MVKHLKKFALIAVALCLALAAIVLVACDPKSDDTDLTTYAVTVTCDDEAALNGVKVQLFPTSGATVHEKALSDGKATFELPAADYTVVLVNVPDGYSFAEDTLSATKTSCTIEMKQGHKYTVTVPYPTMKDVYGNVVRDAAPAEGVTVALYEGQLKNDLPSTLEKLQPVATKKTDANGKAEFVLTGELYTVILSDYQPGLKVYFEKGVIVYTVSLENPTYNAAFDESDRYICIFGTQKAPLTLTLGDNSIPLTSSAISNAGGEGVYYSFTPEKSGNYTFTVTGANNAVILENYMPVLQGPGSKTLALEAGKTYTYSCGAGLSTDHPTFTPYTITIAEGGEISGGGESGEYPWDGEGTLNSPYILTTFEGEYSFLIPDNSSLVYLSYTPKSNETYTVRATCDDIWLDLDGGSDGSSQTYDGSDGSSQTYDGAGVWTLNLTAGKTYILCVDVYDIYGSTVSFTVTKS